MTAEIICLLDAVGTFAFAYFGAAHALRAQQTYLIAALCGFLTAFGGGTIRETMLAKAPGYLHYPGILLIGIAGVTIAIASRRLYHRLHASMLLLDAIGLATFAYIGAARANQVHGGLPLMVAFAILTASGGGLMATAVIRRRPVSHEIIAYNVPVLFVATSYIVLTSSSHPALIALLIGYMVRVSWLFVHKCLI